MTAVLFQYIVVLAASAIFFKAEPVLNRMSPCTPFRVRAAFHLVALGAAAQALWVISGEPATGPSAIITIGIAAMMLADRRVKRR